MERKRPTVDTRAEIPLSVKLHGAPQCGFIEKKMPLFIMCTLQYSESLFPHVSACWDAGVRAQGQPWYRPFGAERVKGNSQGPPVTALVLLGLMNILFKILNYSWSCRSFCSSDTFTEWTEGKYGERKKYINIMTYLSKHACVDADWLAGVMLIMTSPPVGWNSNLLSLHMKCKQFFFSMGGGEIQNRTSVTVSKDLFHYFYKFWVENWDTTTNWRAWWFSEVSTKIFQSWRDWWTNFSQFSLLYQKSI